MEFQQVSTVPTFNSWFPLQRFPANYVFAIQEDKARPGNLLVGTVNSLLSVPLEADGAAIAIAGNPNFEIASFDDGTKIEVTKVRGICDIGQKMLSLGRFLDLLVKLWLVGCQYDKIFPIEVAFLLCVRFPFQPK